MDRLLVSAGVAKAKAIEPNGAVAAVGQSACQMEHYKISNDFRRAQLTTFAVLFAGYASYTYNRKSVSFALPNLLNSGLLDKNGAGNFYSKD